MNNPVIDKFLNTRETKEINEIVGDVLADRTFDIQGEIKDRLTYTRRVSVNDIVPESYQQKLMEIDYTLSQCFWIIGDITKDLVNSVNRQRARELGKVVSKQDIFEAVGFFCHRTGRRVRYYYECAWFFPLEVRQKYDVPFGIFGEARWVKDWEVFLQIAEQNPMWSVERVRAEYYKSLGEEVPVPEHRDKVVDEAVHEDGLPLPQEGEQWVGGKDRFQEVLLSKLDHTTSDLRAVLDRIPLPTEIRVRIGNLILEIQNIELEIHNIG